MRNLLSIHGLKTYFYTEGHIVEALDGIDLHVGKGKTEGLVGESGCGKTVTGLSIMGLVPSPGRILEGEILFQGEDLLKKNRREMQRIRGNHISMIFQDPWSCLNPVLTIGTQVMEVFRLHRGMGAAESRSEAIKMLELVGIPDPLIRMKEYPYQLSGGMRQRIMIAIALSCSPSLLIADEPTTALDVTIQAQILNLLKELVEETEASLLLITHDLSVVAEICENVTVMYAGTIMERAPVRDLFKNPLHPYTRGLLDSIPRIDTEVKRLKPIEGTVPDLGHPPSGCRFHPRCPQALEVCSRQRPGAVEMAKGHFLSCWNSAREAHSSRQDR